MSVTVREYLDPAGRSAYARWFHGLNAPAAAKVATAIAFGPGYRVYFGREREHQIVLLGGSSKKGQQAVIDAAQKAWAAYKQAKPKTE